MTPAPGFLLEVDDLTVRFPTARGDVLANDAVSLRVRRSETLGIVGESGSGKSVFCRALLGLSGGRASARRLIYDGRDMNAMSARERARLRGSEIAMIFQSPMSSLDPVWSIGDQLVETIRLGEPRANRATARRRAVELLDRVGIPAAAARIDDYAHQWSGGMLQRAVIALAIARGPRLMLADEPTTALDVTIQAQILDLLDSLRENAELTMIFVTHDLGVIAKIADRVAVMYAGRIVEIADTRTLFARPAHPYTAGLIASRVSNARKSDRLTPIDGHPPDLRRLGPGCTFAPRCPYARPECLGTIPRVDPGAEHSHACLFPLNVAEHADG